jgi:hypothetical protein
MIDESQGSHIKGTSLEEEFRRYLVKQLHYDRALPRKMMRSNVNIRNTNVDVIGERISTQGIRFKKIAAFITGVLLGMLGMILWLFHQPKAIIAALIILVILLAVCVWRFLRTYYYKELAWVECKNLQDRATANHIRLLVKQYEEYKATGQKEGRVAELYFVSANGFYENAIEMAMVADIKCYVKTETGRFKRIG